MKPPSAAKADGIAKEAPIARASGEMFSILVMSFLVVVVF
jgi:hypothetical protein